MISGTVGGVGIALGTVGLLRLKMRSSKVTGGQEMTIKDYGLLSALAFLALSGLAALLTRDTGAFGLVFLVHLAAICLTFAAAPYKQVSAVHVVFRFLALGVRDNLELAGGLSRGVGVSIDRGATAARPGRSPHAAGRPAPTGRRCCYGPARVASAAAMLRSLRGSRACQVGSDIHCMKLSARWSPPAAPTSPSARKSSGGPRLATDWPSTLRPTGDQVYGVRGDSRRQKCCAHPAARVRPLRPGPNPGRGDNRCRDRAGAHWAAVRRGRPRSWGPSSDRHRS